MKIDVINRSGSSTGRSVELPSEVFGVTPNEHVVYLAVKQYLAAQRQGTHKAKEKWEVSRTTKKLKKQKGTGGARAGSMKSPLFKGGGTVFGPRPRKYVIHLNKKVKALARHSVLADKAASGNIKVLEDIKFDTPKTKEFAQMLASLGLSGKKTLFILPDYNVNVYRSGRNIPNTRIVTTAELNTYDVLKASEVILFESTVANIK